MNAHAHTSLESKFNMISRTDFFMCFHIMFQISLQKFKGQRICRNPFGVRSELLESIYTMYNILSNCFVMGRSIHIGP